MRIAWSRLLLVRQGERIGPSLGSMFTEGFEITRLNKRMGRENIMEGGPSDQNVPKVRIQNVIHQINSPSYKESEFATILILALVMAKVEGREKRM